MKSTLAVFVLFCCFGQAGSQTTLKETGESESCKMIEQAIAKAHKIKPGWSRRDVEKEFIEEGGMQTRDDVRYIYRRCSFIHVRIHFKLVQPKNSMTPSEADTVTSVSALTLGYPTVD